MKRTDGLTAISNRHGDSFEQLSISSQRNASLLRTAPHRRGASAMRCPARPLTLQSSEWDMQGLSMSLWVGPLRVDKRNPDNHLPWCEPQEIFSVICSLWTTLNEAECRIDVKHSEQTGDYTIHSTPTFTDFPMI